MGMLVCDSVCQGVDLLRVPHVLRKTYLRPFGIDHQGLRRSRRQFDTRSYAATSVTSSAKDIVVVGGGWAGAKNERYSYVLIGLSAINISAFHGFRERRIYRSSGPRVSHFGVSGW